MNVTSPVKAKLKETELSWICSKKKAQKINSLNSILISKAIIIFNYVLLNVTNLIMYYLI